MTDRAELVHAFIARINDQDVPGLLVLMTPDHRLIDSGGRYTLTMDPYGT